MERLADHLLVDSEEGFLLIAGHRAVAHDRSAQFVPGFLAQRFGGQPARPAQSGPLLVVEVEALGQGQELVPGRTVASGADFQHSDVAAADAGSRSEAGLGEPPAGAELAEDIGQVLGFVSHSLARYMPLNLLTWSRASTPTPPAGTGGAGEMSGGITSSAACPS